MGRAKTGSTQEITTTVAGHSVAHDPANDWSYLFWFKMPDNSGEPSDFENLLAEVSGGTDRLSINPKRTAGTLTAFYRPGGPGQPSVSAVGSVTVDDDTYRWCLITWDSATSTLELSYDGTSDATATNLSVTQTFTEGNFDVSRNGSGPVNGTHYARLMNFTRKLTFAEAETLARGRLVVQPNLWWEMGWGDPEPDYSGNGIDGTIVNSMPVGDHPAVASFFEHDHDWQGAFKRGLSIPIARYYYDHLCG